jgi:hypothetical protein
MKTIFLAMVLLAGTIVPAYAQDTTVIVGGQVKKATTTAAPSTISNQRGTYDMVWCQNCTGGSGGGGDASAANQSTQITAVNLTNTILGAVTASPTQYTIADRLKTLSTALGSPFQAGGSIGNTAFGISGTLPAFASTPTFNLGTLNGAATSALQTTGNTSLGTIAGAVATTGSAIPTTGLLAIGKDQSGNARGIATSTNGGLMPGQAAPTSTRTAISASTITTIDSARSGRVGLTVQVEAVLTANLFLCANGQSGTCSATVYDAMVPSGASAGTIYTFIFAPTGAIYAFTTGTPTVNTTSWLAQ